MRDDDLMKQPDPMDRIEIDMTREEAEGLSWGLSDLLCWMEGFAAARSGTDLDGGPMGIEAVRTLNLKLKGAL